MTTKWIETPNGVNDIPVGYWCVVMEDGKPGFCEASKGNGCIHYIINGHFYFDMEPVVAYCKFPLWL